MPLLKDYPLEWEPYLSLNQVQPQAFKLADIPTELGLMRTEFDAMPLTEVKIVGTTANGEIRRGFLHDDTVVIVRPISSDGAPTIEIQDNNRPSGRPRTTQEIRFGQKR